jgi:hypothetical protein
MMASFADAGRRTTIPEFFHNVFNGACVWRFMKSMGFKKSLLSMGELIPTF